MKNSRADALRWLRQAENDLEVARLALREGFYAHACFMSHQVVEKALKALAYFRGDRYVSGHSLIDLSSSLEASYPQLEQLLKLMNKLDRYYIPTRYPDAVPGGVPFELYERDEAEEAVEGATQVLGVVQQVVS